MGFRKALIAACAGLLLLWGSAWAQRGPSPQSAGPQDSSQNPAQSQPGSVQAPVAPGNTEEPSPASSSTSMNKGSGKEQHWSGSLVDIPCMAKMLDKQQGATSGGSANPATPQSGVPRFMGSGFAGQAGQQPGGAITPGAGTPGQAPATPSLPGQSPDNSGMTPAQQAQIAKAERVDKAAKQCAASASTLNFGLAMSGGQVVQFDSEGNSKAQEALKQVEVQPGKKIKAKVTGTLQNNVTVKVASVEVKGKRAAGAGR
jgi:hypothetical protein